jgi:hypothetical protein
MSSNPGFSAKGTNWADAFDLFVVDRADGGDWNGSYPFKALRLDAFLNQCPRRWMGE